MMPIQPYGSVDFILHEVEGSEQSTVDSRFTKIIGCWMENKGEGQVHLKGCFSGPVGTQ